MNFLSLFMRIRTAVFATMILSSLAWSTVLCVELSLRWDVSQPSQRNLVFLLIFVNSSTSIILPTMLTMQFKAWLEVVRLVFLLSLQIGFAALFTVWSPTFSCLDGTSDCRSINTFILAGSWVNPSILICYSVLLVALRCWVRLHPEAAIYSEKRQSELPMMSPPDESQTQVKVPSGLFEALAPAMAPLSVQPATGSFKRGSSPPDSGAPRRSSGRLSKRLPSWF